MTSRVAGKTGRKDPQLAADGPIRGIAIALPLMAVFWGGVALALFR